MPKVAPTISSEYEEFLSCVDRPPQEIELRLSNYHNSEIYCICVSNNGSLVATCGGDKKIKLFDVTKK